MAAPPANPVIRDLQWDIQRATERKRDESKRTKARTQIVRRSSRQEKIVFGQKHRALALYMAEEFKDSPHYLDLEPTARALVDELFQAHQTVIEKEQRRQAQAEKVREEHRKQETRLLHKGKSSRAEAELRHHFEIEYPEEARLAHEVFQQSFFELTPDWRQLVIDEAVNLRKGMVSDPAAAKRMQELEFRLTSLRQQGPQENGSTERRADVGQRKPDSNRRLRTVNLETGYPTVPQARDTLADELKTGKRNGTTALKLIHGYGPTGNGGAIRDAIRHSLHLRRKNGSIRLVVHGERWSAFSDESRQILDACPILAKDRDLERSNPGITLVLL